MRRFPADYVGIPFQNWGRSITGCDCGGLIILIYADQLGVSLDDHMGSYLSAADPSDAEVPLTIERDCGEWARVDTPEPLDVALLSVVSRKGVFSAHVGLVVDGGTMIHATSGAGQAVLASLSGIEWGKRVEGYYRHASQL